MTGAKVARTLEKFGNSFDNTGSNVSDFITRVASKSESHNKVTRFLGNNSMTIGAAVEGMAIESAQGAVIGGTIGAIDDDSSAVGGAVKGAAVGAALGGIKSGTISHVLQKTAPTHGGVGFSKVDYSRINLNKELLVNRAFNDINGATRTSDLTIASNMMKQGSYKRGNRKEFFEDAFDAIKN